MAIKISGTEVINDSRELVNITGADGVYSNFHTSPQTVATTTLNFDHPIQYQLMTANRTYTETNKATGRHSLFLLDRSGSSYTPTFSANVKWAGGTTPTWSSYRHWMISMQCVSGTVVRASAEGYTGSAPTETVSLSGTSGSPQQYVGPFPYFQSGTWYVDTGFSFGSDGNIYRYTYQNGSNVVFSTTSWNNTTPSQTYYIRFTNDTGASGIGQQTPNSGDSLGTWHALSSYRSFRWAGTETFGSYGSRFIQCKVEIATDSGGSNIIATGYYNVFWEGGA